MGIVFSKRSHAHDRDEELLEMHRYVFSRAMRKQDKRLEKDAKALEKARRRSGKGKYRASTIMGWKGGGYAGLREECARRNAIAERRRAAEREARREREREENLAQLERIRDLERDRARQLAEERERDLARYRAARAEERSQCSSPALTERSAPGTPDGPGRFDALLAECARKDSVAKMRAREREDRRRRRAATATNAQTNTDATATNAQTNTAATATTAEATTRLDFAPSRADDPDEPPSPVAVAPSAAAAAAAAVEEGRTDALGAPGASRGGLRAKYEQVKVFRDGNSLFHCARLAEIACQAVERGGDDLDLDDERRSSAGDAVAAVLRRGIRSLGQSQAAATAQSLREGALRRVATVAEDAELESESSFSLAATKFSSSLSSDPSARAGLSADVTPTEVDAAIVRAVAGADLLCRNMQACPAAGAPLDNWRRAMISVGDRADAEIPPGDRELRPDEIDAGAAAVRDAYVRAMSRSNVPATELEVAALAAHLKRPVELIRGPASEGRSEGDGWRATCAATTYGAAHGRRGRAGFTLFWELGEGVPMGLPAGDFVLLVPREGMGRRRTAGAPGAGARAGARTGAGTGTAGARGSLASPARTGTAAASPAGVSPGMSRARVGEERDGERGWSRAPPSAERNAGDVAAGMLAAAADGNKVAVHRHARRGVSLAETDERGDTALHRAAASGSIGLVKAVLRHADRPGQPTRREMLEAVNVDGDTPLAAAARLGRVKLAKFLRREGAADPAGLLGRERAGGYASASSSAGYSSSAPSEGTSASDASDSESERGGGSREWAGHGGEWAGHGGEWAGHGGEWAGHGGEWGGHGGSFHRREGGVRRGGVGSGFGSASADGSATDASATSGAFGSESDFSDSDFAGNANRRSYRSRAPGFWSDATPRGSDAETDAENASLWNSESESSYRGGDTTDGYGTDATDTSEGSRPGDGGPTVRVPSADKEEGEPSRFRAMGGGRGGDNVYRARDRDESRAPSFLR